MRGPALRANTEDNMDTTNLYGGGHDNVHDGGHYDVLNMTSDVSGGLNAALNDSDADYYNYYSLQECGEATIPNFTEYKVAMVLQYYLYPILLVLGTLGNVICLPLLKRLSTYAWSTCLYLAVLSMVELVVLYIRCGGFWLGLVAGANPLSIIMESSDALCKISLFLLNFLQQMWPWLLVAVGVELLIAIRFPLKTYEYCTTERARATVLLLIILLVCLNLNYFWTWGLAVEEASCIYINAFASDFMETVWPSIAMAVEHIVPLAVVTFCFVVTVLTLLKSDRDLCGADGEGCCGGRSRSFNVCRRCSCGGVQRQASYEPILRKYFLDMEALQQLKRVVLLVQFLFIAVKTLAFAVELINALLQREVIVVPCENIASYTAAFYLVRTINDSAVYCFFSLKFFLYFALCGRFRRTFVGFVRCVCSLCCRLARRKTPKEEEEEQHQSQHHSQPRRGPRRRGEDEEGEAEWNGRVVRDNEANCLRLQQNNAFTASSASSTKSDNATSRPFGATNNARKTSTSLNPKRSSSASGGIGGDYDYDGELNKDYSSHDFPPPPPPLNKTTQI